MPRLPVPALLLLLTLSVPAGAVRLSPCQGQFGSDRGPAYTFELETRGLELDEVVRETITQLSRALYDSWGDLLSAPPPFSVEVKLLLVGEQDLFLSLQRSLAPELHSVSGFYTVSSNRAVALYPGNDVIQARRSAIHEVSHLLTTTQLGAAPQWLAEGLAEYYEMVTVRADGRVVVPPNDRHLKYLTTTEPPSLTDFFGTPPEKWQQAGGKEYYSIAWSLVFFMMDSVGGRGALGLVLQQGSTHSCLPWSASAFLHQAWPGGLPDLERHWREWLALGGFSAQLL